MPRTRILVVGAGVIGLSCAVRLAEAGFDVEIRARDLPPHTTSNVAAALWYPYAVSPRERVEAWARTSYAAFVELARDPATGVIVRSGVELFPWVAEVPTLLRGLPGFRAANASELRSGFASGWVFEAPVIETSIYLAWLVERARALGVRIVAEACTSLDTLLEHSPIVVNCAGLGARELARDPSMYAIRGQVVRVGRCGVERFVLDDHGPGGITYVIPRSHDCVLGGTAEERREDLEIDAAQSEAIRARCTALEPLLSKARVLGEAVGLRPGRPTVRLELERRGDRRGIVHAYGHGGAGVTLSWGSADEVCNLVRSSSPSC